MLTTILFWAYVVTILPVVALLLFSIHQDLVHLFKRTPGYKPYVLTSSMVTTKVIILGLIPLVNLVMYWLTVRLLAQRARQQ